MTISKRERLKKTVSNLQHGDFYLDLFEDIVEAFNESDITEFIYKQPYTALNCYADHPDKLTSHHITMLLESHPFPEFVIAAFKHKLTDSQIEWLVNKGYGEQVFG